MAHLCRRADNLIKFELTGQGAIVGVDNGNQISHESFKAKQRRHFMEGRWRLSRRTKNQAESF